MAEKNKYTAIGRRKRSVAKVTLVPGKGNITVNGKDVKDYMPYETLVMDLVQQILKKQMLKLIKKAVQVNLT